MRSGASDTGSGSSAGSGAGESTSGGSAAERLEQRKRARDAEKNGGSGASGTSSGASGTSSGTSGTSSGSAAGTSSGNPSRSGGAGTSTEPGASSGGADASTGGAAGSTTGAGNATDPSTNRSGGADGPRDQSRDRSGGDPSRSQDNAQDRRDGGSLRDRLEGRDNNRDVRDGRRDDARDDNRDARDGRRDDLRDRREDVRDDRRDARRDQYDSDQRRRLDRIEERLREERRDARDDRRDRRDENFDFVRENRRERRDGSTTYITESDGRTIIRDGDRTIIRRDEGARFRVGVDSRNIREERNGGEIRTYVTRPDGSRVITVTDEDGRLIRRSREFRGEEYVLIDNTPRGGGRRNRGRDGVFLDLDIAPPPVTVARERYIVDADDASYGDVEEAFAAPPVAKLQRSYSLDEIRQSAPLRSYVRSVDLDAITFDTGKWDVRDDQIEKLEKVGLAMEAAIKKNPKTVFMVEGHTDAVGADNDNLSLSDRRAESVAEVLTKYFDLPAENLTTQGYGEQYLKVKTDGAEERNRRVTVRNITPLLTSENRN